MQNEFSSDTAKLDIQFLIVLKKTSCEILINVGDLWRLNAWDTHQSTLFLGLELSLWTQRTQVGLPFAKFQKHQC